MELLLTMLLILATGAFFLSRGQDTLARNSGWVSEVKLQYEGLHEAPLLEAAVQYDLVAVDPETRQITLASPTEADLIVQASRARERESSSGLDVVADSDDPFYSLEATRNLLLRPSGPGATIRREIQLYNRMARFIGLRQAGAGETALDCVQNTRTEIRRWAGAQGSGCHWVSWTARYAIAPALPRREAAGQDVLQGQKVGALARAMTGEARPGPEFGVYARMARDLYGDWKLYSTQAAGWARIRFEISDLGLLSSRGDGEFVLDFIGSGIEISPALAAAAQRMDRFCWPSQQAPLVERCAQLAPPAQEAGLRLRLRYDQLRPGMWVELAGSQRLSTSFPSETRLNLTTRLGVECRRGDCTLRWVGAPTQANISAPEIVVQRQGTLSGSDGVQEGGIAPPVAALRQATLLDRAESRIEELALSDLAGLVAPGSDGVLQPSPAANARELGMILGVNSQQDGTLLKIVDRAPVALDVAKLRLTVEDDLQEAAAVALARGLREQAWLPTRFNKHRQAAIAVIDLQSGQPQARPGALLAAVSFPPPVGQLSKWDLDNLEQSARGRAVTQSGVWAARSQAFTPGSVAKPLSALALIDAATGLSQGPAPQDRAVIAQALWGADRAFYRDVIGFDPAQDEVLVPFDFRAPQAEALVLNDASGRAPLSAAGQAADGCAAARTIAGEVQGPLGLCAAISQSSNIWFGVLSRLGNDEAVATLLGQPGARQLTTAGQTALRLGLANPDPLVLLPERLREILATPGPRMDPIQMDGAPGLSRGETTPLAGAPPRTSWADLIVTLNGYGQAMQITPAAMAGLMGSIALNRTVSPHVSYYEGQGAPLGAELYPLGSQGEALLWELKNGLEQVVQNPAGTAYASFQTLGSRAGRVSGKTGTATISVPGAGPEDPRVYTSWFAGWNTSREDQTPKYGFACAISHVQNLNRPNRSTQLCARVIADFLSEVTQAAQGKGAGDTPGAETGLPAGPGAPEAQTGMERPTPRPAR